MKQLLKPIFWDTDFEKLDFKKHSFYVIERILEYGDIPQIRLMQKMYPPSEIKAVVLKSRNLTQKSANFWADYYQLPKERVRCLSKSFLKIRKSIWPY